MMTKKYIWIEDHKEISPEGERVLFDGLNKNAFLKKQMNPIKPFGIFIRNVDEEIVGGATGISIYGCLYLDMLFLKEDLRHLGFGKELMYRAENIGRKNHCSFAAVNTMDWEALAFYQKLGFQIEFVREGYEKQSKMYFLRKQLD